MMSRKAEEDPEEMLEMEEEVETDKYEKSGKCCQFTKCRSN